MTDRSIRKPTRRKRSPRPDYEPPRRERRPWPLTPIEDWIEKEKQKEKQKELERPYDDPLPF